MPSIYIDSDFNDLIRTRQKKLMREKAEREGKEPSEVHIPRRVALRDLLADRHKQRLTEDDS